MTAKGETSRTLRVGAVVAASVFVLMLFIFFIGAEQKVFARKHEYKMRVQNVSGLAQGNPVQLAGVTIGTVKEIDLPESPDSRAVNVTLMVDRAYAQRIREDSRARVKKLGLIASDSYVEITPGTLAFKVLPPGSIIATKESTDVDKILASGEDLVDNFLQISYSLKNVLSRVDRGEGLLGELTVDSPRKQKITDTALNTLNRTNAILDQVQQGRGVLGKLVSDEAYAARLTGSLQSSAASLESITGSINRGEGVLGALVRDPEGKAKVDRLVENMTLTSENLAAVSQSMREGQGLFPRLMNDREYGDETLREFQLLVSRLSETARKLNEGEGTAGKLVNDPAIYESINDIIIGINESKMLRWLVRNRQEKGIETRYKAAQDESQQTSPAAEPAPTAANGPTQTTSHPNPDP